MSNKMQLDIRFGNIYVGNKTTRRAMRFLKKGAPDGIVLNEGRKALRFASMFSPRYRVHYASHSESAGGRADVLVMVHKRNRYLGELVWEVMRERPNVSRAWHTRYAVAALFEHPTQGKIALVGVHPSPAPAVLNGKNRKHPLGAAYREFVESLEKGMDHLKEQGFAIILCGDIQIREGAASDMPWDPYAMIRRSHMTIVEAKGIDLIAASRHLAHVGSVMAPANSKRTGSDHPFLSGLFRKK